MNAERQTELILSHVETWGAELERAVQCFEEAVTHAEQRMDEVEQMERAHEAGEDEPGLQLLLTHALNTSHEVEERVATANTSLGEALSQAELTLRSSAPEDELAPLQVGTPV